MTENTPDAVKVLERLIATARLLYANAEGCALNHHGADFELHGMPGWLTDCAADIAAAQSLGARAMQAAMAEAALLRAEVERKDKALEAAEACMSIVAPRRDTAKYLQVLAEVRTALGKAESPADTKAGG